MNCPKIPIGNKKGLQKRLGGYKNGFVKPGDRELKRNASKRVREDDDIPDGAFYKRLWGYWEWV